MCLNGSYCFWKHDDFMSPVQFFQNYESPPTQDCVNALILLLYHKCDIQVPLFHTRHWINLLYGLQKFKKTLNFFLLCELWSLFLTERNTNTEAWRPPQGSERAKNHKATGPKKNKKKTTRVGYLDSNLMGSEASNSSVWETDRRSESSTCRATLSDSTKHAPSQLWVTTFMHFCYPCDSEPLKPQSCPHSINVLTHGDPGGTLPVCWLLGAASEIRHACRRYSSEQPCESLQQDVNPLPRELGFGQLGQWIPPPMPR